VVYGSDYGAVPYGIKEHVQIVEDVLPSQAGPYPLRWTPGFSCPICRESEKWVQHAAHLRRSTRSSR